MEYSEENISNNDYMKSLLRQIHKLTIRNVKLEIENDELKKQLKLYDVVKSLPIQDLPNCNRVEVIDQKGRSYVNWKPTNKVRLSMQDDGKTAKIFID